MFKITHILIFKPMTTYTSMVSSTVVAIGPIIATVPSSHNDLDKQNRRYSESAPSRKTIFSHYMKKESFAKHPIPQSASCSRSSVLSPFLLSFLDYLNLQLTGVSLSYINGLAKSLWAPNFICWPN